MRNRILTILIALAVTVGAAASSFGQVGGLSFPGPGGGHSSGGSSPTVYAGGTSALAPGFPNGPWTSAAVDLGPVTATRYITVMVMSGGAGGTPPQASFSVTLGSTSMTKIFTS